jgi:succinate dehydrogenase/fumarate reductase iron-sulfur protein
MADDGKLIEIEVLRYRPEQDKEPFFQTYQVPFTDDMSVLQGLQHIKDYLDGSLSFRWSCRMAICGSCGEMINGIPKLGCKTFLRDYYPGKVRVEPLAHFPIERDLVVGVEDFIGKLESIKPYIIPKEPRTLAEGRYCSSARASTACSATQRARNTGSTRTSSGPACSRCCIATTPTRAMARGRREWSWSTPKRACGAAPRWVIAPKCVRSRSTPPMRSTRTRPRARSITFCGS